MPMALADIWSEEFLRHMYAKGQCTLCDVWEVFVAEYQGQSIQDVESFRILLDERIRDIRGKVEYEASLPTLWDVLLSLQSLVGKIDLVSYDDLIHSHVSQQTWLALTQVANAVDSAKVDIGKKFQSDAETSNKLTPI